MCETTNEQNIYPKISLEDLAKIHSDLTAERIELDGIEKDLIEELSLVEKGLVMVCPLRINRMYNSENISCHTMFETHINYQFTELSTK